MKNKNSIKKELGEDIKLDSGYKKPSFKITPLKFKSKKQKDFFDLCRSDDTSLLICDGPAGVGKSLIAIYAALKMIKAGKYERIMYVRTPIDSSDAGIGYLPGDIYEKTTNYMIPMEEKLNKLLTYDQIKMLLNEDLIESTVNSYMRGRSINDTIVIVDEIQNYTIPEIKTLLTRFEENTKIIGLGDKSQSDIGIKSCLNKLILMFGHEDETSEAYNHGVFTFKFDIDDIVRSELTKYIVKIFDKHDKISRS